jgi:hypothetical protein
MSNSNLTRRTFSQTTKNYKLVQKFILKYIYFTNLERVEHVLGWVRDEGKGGKPDVHFRSSDVTADHEVRHDRHGLTALGHGQGIQEELPVRAQREKTF